MGKLTFLGADYVLEKIIVGLGSAPLIDLDLSEVDFDKPYQIEDGVEGDRIAVTPRDGKYVPVLGYALLAEKSKAGVTGTKARLITKHVLKRAKIEPLEEVVVVQQTRSVRPEQAPSGRGFQRREQSSFNRNKEWNK